MLNTVNILLIYALKFSPLTTACCLFSGSESMDDSDCNLNSVVRILEHLALKHRTGVKNAMMSLFKVFKRQIIVYPVFTLHSTHTNTIISNSHYCLDF